MIAIYKKEIQQLFNTMEAYVAISLFFIVNGIILWFIPSEYNILHNNQASLLPFFTISPWVLLFLIPAITMKLINVEITQKTSIILFTKPIKIWEIIIGKFLASSTMSIVSIMPSMIFIYSIYQLSNPIGNIDTGEIIGSYIGLILLIILYNAIGLLGSSLFQNNMVTLICTMIIIAILYFCVGFLGDFYNNSILKYLSIDFHYQSISRGIIDSRNIIYFLSTTIFFLYVTVQIIQNKKL